MASYEKSSFSFMADFCNEETCLKGDFIKCQKKHEILIRDGKADCIIANEVELNEKVDSDEESDFQVNIYESSINQISDNHIQFIDDNPNPSVLDDLIEDHDSNADEIIAISDDEYADETPSEQLAETRKILETLNKYPMISLFSSSDQFLSQLHIEDSCFHSVEAYLQSLTNTNANLGHCYGSDVRKRDMSCLQPNSWLNDTIINLCFLLIQEKCLANNIELDIVSSHWYSRFLVSNK